MSIRLSDPFVFVDKLIETVVIVNDHAVVNGGQAKVAIDTALALRKRGLNVIFFSGTAGVDARLQNAGVNCVTVGNYEILHDPQRLRAGIRGLWNVQSARALREVLRGLNSLSTIVHVHGWAKSLSPSIGPVLVQSKIPNVYTLHEYFLACPNGGFYHYPQGEQCFRKPLGIRCLTTNCDARNVAHKAWRSARHIGMLSASKMPKLLRDFIYLTETQLSIIKPYLPGDARFYHLPNPIERTSVKRVVAEAQDTYLFVGRLSSEKGAILAAKAARAANVPIAFAGEGDCRDAILDANPDAAMLGWLAPGALTEVMQRSKCLLFPSLWPEPYGLVVLEAMQCGLPVLVSDNTAAAEFVEDNESGLRVRKGEVSAWVDAMSRMKEPALVGRLSAGAFRQAATFLAPHSYFDQLVAVYTTVHRANVTVIN